MPDISKLVVQGTLYDVKDTIARNRAESALESVEGVIAQATGATQGNAELLDIRVGFDGTNYQTAGAAVRGQVQQLSTVSTTLSGKVGNIQPITEAQMSAFWDNAE